MIADEIVKRARRILKDEDKDTVRWTDAVMLHYVDEAQRELERLAPYFFLNSNNTMDTLADITKSSDTLFVDEDARRPLIDLTVWFALSEDTDDTSNIAVAERYRSRALNLVGARNG